MNEQKSTEVAGGFDPAAWLGEKFLELKSLLQLARGVHPIHGKWPPPDPWDARWRQLKMVIDQGHLPADLRRRVVAGKWTIVYLKPLWAFVTELNRVNNDGWAWARDFCQQWAKASGETLPDPDKSESSEAKADSIPSSEDEKDSETLSATESQRDKRKRETEEKHQRFFELSQVIKSAGKVTGPTNIARAVAKIETARMKEKGLEEKGVTGPNIHRRLNDLHPGWAE